MSLAECFVSQMAVVAPESTKRRRRLLFRLRYNLRVYGRYVVPDETGAANADPIRNNNSLPDRENGAPDLRSRLSNT